MLRRILLAAFALAVAAPAADAGWFRSRRSRSAPPPQWHYQQQQTFTAASFAASSTQTYSQAAAGPEGDGLAEVNAKRAQRGLRPFVRDEGLTQAARGCAAARAARLLFGHTPNDFAYVPPGSRAASAGCAAYPASYGWMSCCVYDHYTYAGAAWVQGRDGKRYMSLFVR
jgi:uncharacterized protein YkwD